MKEIPVSAQPMILFAEECDRGILREENQDSVFHVRIAMGDLMMVADGIGGYAGGAIASRMVVELLDKRASGTCAWIGHIGDSRAYLVRAGRLHRLTTDHSAVQVMLSHNLITPEEAKNHPDASVLTRSLGHQFEVEIDIEQHPLALGDTLLLCSDGLWGFVSELDIEKVVDAPGRTLESSAHGLLELALTAGGSDNISIEMARLVELRKVDSPPPPSHP